ncbi:MAG: hypothetical protein ACOCP4_03955 [Candidatus Woesearchaeota archaeon]
MKKAEGLSMNLIVVTAVALVVLVVLVAIFTGRMGGFTSDVDSSTQCVSGFGGECILRSQAQEEERSVIGIGEGVGCSEGEVCVERVYEDNEE